ncbi:reverse transcriptase [Plakobranchus ocellatus]|uniref:Reverse transcriptase n=1 Tax=Plakobranchus ocellatus TaxID=259542 RepID=A0AAV4CVG5_9GAST|nr:reverse transcriptase [Plakobranchus ocellatus]
MIWEAIQRAKAEKLNLDVVWLDLANAYGSVPHEMIQLALRMYHVPEKVILKAAEGSAGPANLGGGCSMPLLKAFMDDTTIICSKEDETMRMLTRLDVLMLWCRMEFKPKKFRSLSIRKGKVDKATTFTVADQRIQTVKSLGRCYDSCIKDARRGAETLDLASERLLAINKCGLQGIFKICCLQLMLILKLLWPLLAHDICSTTAEAIEAKINKYTRKWLGVPPGLSDVAMYRQKAKLKLSMKSILESLNAAKPDYSPC